MLSSNQIFEWHEDTAWRVLDGQAFIVALRGGELHKLNPTGTRIWELIGKRLPLDAILETLLDEFDTDPDTAAADLHDFVSSLLDAGCIRPIPSGL